MRRTAFLTLMVLAGSGVALAEDGGPDQLQVSGITTKKHLNVRSGPSLSDGVIASIAPGSIVKNLGCEKTKAGRWCHIDYGNGKTGYSFGAFLKEASAMAEAPAAAPAAPPAPPKFSIGKVACERNNGSPAAECSYGIMRVSATMARLQVVWPDTTKRMFGIFGKTVTSGDGPVAVKAGADGSLDLMLAPAGVASEHIMVPANVISGTP